MKIILLPVFLVLMLSLSGCSLFGWYMNGSPHENRIIDRDEWTKPNLNEAQRKEDWISCGGNSAGYFAFNGIKEGQSRFEQSIQADKEYDAGQACMIKKGYRYTGSCRGESSRLLSCKGKSIFNL